MQKWNHINAEEFIKIQSLIWLILIFKKRQIPGLKRNPTNAMISRGTLKTRIQRRAKNEDDLNCNQSEFSRQQKSRLLS